MSDVIFARPRYDYDSYQDLYRLITLSGYPLIFFDEIDPQSDHCYILTLVNGEIQAGWPDAHARIILYDLEWRLNGEYPRLPGISEVWAADRWYAAQIGARYVPLGSHPGLNLHPDDPMQPAYDVAMLAYMTPRRDQMAVWLRQRGITLSPRGWGEERHQALIRTRAMLQVHQHDWAATTAPQRFALAAAYHLPLISEQAADPGIFEQAVLWAGYADLPAATERWLHDDLTAQGEALYQLLCVERTFQSEVEKAL